MKISIAFFKYVHNVRGIYRFGIVVEKRMTLGANTKAVMNNTEFDKYLSSAILQLYPDAVDTTDKRITIIVDSGPG